MSDVKTDMMRLWKETFHDDDRYIRLVFDTYFDTDNICVRYDGDRLVAALLGVPYRFMERTSKEKPHCVDNTGFLKGLYLCGLATRPEYRSRGIMSAMMEEIQISASERRYDFTFLIPADANLREYYRQRGYSDFSRREKLRLTKYFEIDDRPPLLLRTLFEKKDMTTVRRLAEWCVARERESEVPIMLHSVDDMVTAMAENENAIFYTDCASAREYRNLANVVAVAFPEDMETMMTDEMLKSNPTLPFSWTYRKIFTPRMGENYVSSQEFEKIDSGPYAMARLLPSGTMTASDFPSFSVSLLLD